MKLGTDENNHHTMVNRWDEVLRGIQDLKDTWKLSIREYQGLDEQAEKTGNRSIKKKNRKINALQRDDEVGIKQDRSTYHHPRK